MDLIAPHAASPLRYTKHLQVLIDPETMLEIEAMARAQPCSRAAVVRRLISAGLELKNVARDCQERTEDAEVH